MSFGHIPFIQIEEFVPGVTSVNADFYAFLEDSSHPQPTTVLLQYVTAAGYDPANVEDPYVAGVSVTLAEETTATLEELHVHLILKPDQVYHYRILAKNSDGSFETPDNTVETYPASTGALPDGRAYEQVSPTAKNNLDALGQGQGMSMQASPSSAAPAFAFFSVEPFPVAIGTSERFTVYLSARTPSPAAWLTQGVQAPIEPLGPQGTALNEVDGFTEDLAKAIVQVYGSPVGAPGVQDAYVRDSATGSYQLLAANAGFRSILFVDASRDDSKILFETEQQLLPTAAAGVTNLYEWDGSKPEKERLSLAGVLPGAECGCAPTNGSGAGPGGGEHQGVQGQGYLQNTISEDGSRIFFTAHSSGRVYEREPLAEPSPVTVPVSSGAATFLAATPSGRYVFYSEGSELYRFDTASEERQALTSGAEAVLGSLGVSDDGAYAYFVAKGILATNENANGETATGGEPNLYVWHEDATTHVAASVFIARLLPTELHGDESDWVAASGEILKSSRLNPSGTALLFMSRSRLTGYDNGLPNASACRERVPCPEYFLYTAEEPLSSMNPVCVSCNPSGAVPYSEAGLTEGEKEYSLPGPKWNAHLTRNLSAGGDRVFFETAESLVPGDVNGVSDVYEWERGGVGSCPTGRQHCLYLISTGTAHARSYFGDASASGEDVFLFTRQPLVGQDGDLNYDVYDAKVGGGIMAQNRSTKSCEGEEECRSPTPPTPMFETPGSATLTGAGRPLQVLPVTPSTQVRCAKNQKLSRGKCVAIKCPSGRRLSRGKCIKVKVKAKARGRKTTRAGGRGK